MKKISKKKSKLKFEKNKKFLKIVVLDVYILNNYL